MGEGWVDAIGFTSVAPAVRLFEIAGAADEEPRRRRALEQPAVAAVGPVVAGELRRRGIEPAIMPTDSFFLKPLVSAIVDHFSR